MNDANEALRTVRELQRSWSDALKESHRLTALSTDADVRVVMNRMHAAVDEGLRVVGAHHGIVLGIRTQLLLLLAIVVSIVAITVVGGTVVGTVSVVVACMASFGLYMTWKRTATAAALEALLRSAIDLREEWARFHRDWMISSSKLEIDRRAGVLATADVISALQQVTTEATVEEEQNDARR